MKEGHDFALAPPRDEDTLPIGELVLGHVHDLPPLASLVPGLGVRAALGFVDDELAPRYGTHFPVGAMLFLRLVPQKMAPMSHMSM